MTVKTKSLVAAEDITAHIRARTPILWVVTREEARVEGYLIEAAIAAGWVPRTWDAVAGVLDPLSEEVPKNKQYDGADEVLELIRTTATGTKLNAKDKFNRYAWILRDFHPWVAAGPVGNMTVRNVRNLIRYLPGIDVGNAQQLIILTPSSQVPDDLAGQVTVIEWPLPDRNEIAAALDDCIEGLITESDLKKEIAGEPDKDRRATLRKNVVTREKALPAELRDAAIDAAVGLSNDEAQSCFSKSLVQLKRIDPVAVAQEKKAIIAASGVLRWIEPLRGGLAAVGGLQPLKTWLSVRGLAYTPRGRGKLPAPKGMLLVGVPGCGKTHMAKALATEWGVPLLALDLGALKNMYVGKSEENIRKALRVIDAIGRCIVLVDEIEKSLGGASQGAADGGVSADALGTLLSWMQDREGEAFIVATANNIDALPPELMRAGRLDAIWFVDTPMGDERLGVLKAALAVHGVSEDSISVEEIADASTDYTGAEIAALVPEALFAAFADGERKIKTSDLLTAVEETVPLTTTAADKIAALREKAAKIAKPANRMMSKGASTRSRPRGRVLAV